MFETMDEIYKRYAHELSATDMVEYVGKAHTLLADTNYVCDVEELAVMLYVKEKYNEQKNNQN